MTRFYTYTLEKLFTVAANRLVRTHIIAFACGY